MQYQYSKQYEEQIDSEPYHDEETATQEYPIHNIDLQVPREEAPSQDESWWTFLPQIIACCVAQSIVINSGINLVFSAVLLPQLMENGNELSITADDASWIASLVTIATPIGALLIGPLIDKLGRRTGCIICALLMCASWIFMTCSYSVVMLCFSRMLCGITTGLSTVALVYVSETSHLQVRPALLCLNSVFFSLGILLTCISGAWLSWRNIAICSASMCLLLSVLMCFLPESPHWLAVCSKGVKNSKYWERTESSIRRLYRSERVSAQEIEYLKENFQDIDKAKHSFSISQCLKSCKQRSVIKPIVVLLVLFISQQLSGSYILIFYAVHLFRLIGGKFGSGIDALEALVMMGTIRFVISIIVSILSRRIGRRPLLMVSYIGMSLSTFIIGIYPLSSGTNDADLFKENTSEGNLAPIIFVLLFVCCSAIGVLVLPWTLIVELLPVQVRGVGGGFMISWAYFLMFISVKCFPYALKSLGVSIMFFVFSFISFLGFLHIFLCLPETFGKRFSEIEEYFK